MNIDIVIDFFKWCSIINFSLLALSAIILPLAQDFIYAIHSRLWFSGSRQEHKQIIFKVFAYYKIIVFVFNIVPYIALRIITAQ